MGGPVLPLGGCHTVDGMPDPADTAWMMSATALVFMQTPAIGVCQAGMIRTENLLNMLLQAVVGMAIGSVLWFVWGFSLTFGEDHGRFIGDVYYSMFINMSPLQCYADAPRIPAILYAVFQMMFAVMVPVIVTGAWAEKLNFRAFILFAFIWPHMVYYPVSHWVWGGGWLSNIRDGEGVIDYAGGLTVHTTSGIAALVVARIMNRRENEDKLMDHAHNIPLTLIGGMFIWAGWFGFNGGSSFGANSIASLAIVNTHIAASIAAFVWGMIAFLKKEQYHLTEFVNGAMCGMAAVTPGAGYMLSYGAFCVGVIAAVAGFFSSHLLSSVVDIDDVLDVTSLQGTPGVIGTLLAGCLATPESGNNRTGCFYGDCWLLLYQFVGVSATLAWSGVWTFLTMLFIQNTVGLWIDGDSDSELPRYGTNFGTDPKHPRHRE